MNFHFVLIIFTVNFLCLSNGQTKINFLFSQPVKNQYKGLQKFSINFMNFSGNAKIVTFGGKVKNVSDNSLFVSKLDQNSSAITYNTNRIKPKPRYSHCSLVIDYKLYVYGGISKINDTQQKLTDLWQFNTLFLTWSQISNSQRYLKTCNMVKNSSNILLIGVDQTSQNGELVIIKYSILNRSWAQLSYQYGDFIKIEGKTWYGNTSNLLISVDNLAANDRKLFTNMTYTYCNLLNVDTIRVIPFEKITDSTQDPCQNISLISPADFCRTDYSYFLLTETKILYFDLLNLKIYLIRPIIYDLNTKILDYQISDRWLFIFKLGSSYILNNIITRDLIMEYYSLTNFYESGQNNYSIPYEQSNDHNISIDQLSYQTVIVNGDIYIVSESTLDSWIIYQKCNKSRNIQNLKICFYDQIHCQMGWKGSFCNISVCSNTLYLYDQVKNQQILFECSNHGRCTENGCLCDEHWEGQDCSTYTRTKCKGNLLYNWPVMNCQCKLETEGGNACEIIFCYNDCSDQGQCINGKCQCQSGYYGKDCSITIIQFPGLQVNL